MNKQNNIFFQQIFPIFILLFFCINLFACQSKRETILEQETDFKNYSATSYDIDNNYSDIWKMHYFFDNLYIAAKTSTDVALCKYTKQGTFLEEIKLNLKEDASILDFHISKEGDIFYLITDNPRKYSESSTNQTSFLKAIHFNQKGKKLSSTKLKFPYERNSTFNDYGLFMENSSIAILADQKVFLFDKDGNLLNQNKINGFSPCICLDSHGNLSILSSSSKSEYIVQQLSTSSKKISKKYKTSLPSSGKYWIKAANKDSNYDFIAADIQGIYGYSYQTKKSTPFFQWLKLNLVIQDGSFLDFSCLEKDSFAVLTYNPKGSGLRLIIVEPQENNKKQQEKKELVLYNYDHNNTSINYSIIAWNQQREDYEISMRMDISQLSLDIVAGDGPDILYFPYESSTFDDYVKKGYFMNYDTLMKQMPEGLQKKNLLENLITIYEEAYGGLYFLPVSFTVEVLAGSKKNFPENKQWTLNEFHSLMKKHTPIKFMANSDMASSDPLAEKQLLFDKLFFHCLPNFYNPTSGLNVEKFKELLDFTIQWTSEENKTASQSLLYSEVILGMSGCHNTLKHIEAIYGKNKFQLLGYPCETGTGISIIEKGVFAIVANENSSIA